MSAGRKVRKMRPVRQDSTRTPAAKKRAVQRRRDRRRAVEGDFRG